MLSRVMSADDVAEALDAIAPMRSTRGAGPVQSTIVLAAEPVRGPPSSTTAACAPS